VKEKLLNLFLFVMAAWAWWFRKYSKGQSLGILEQEARMARRGIWSHENPVPPREFRRRAK
jgi:micrococcal nuclease